MFDRLRYLWIPRLCFAVTVTLAVGMALAVGVAPWLDAEETPPAQRLLAVFAHDVLVRRTALVCAVGLVVTACVFFRPSQPPEPPEPTSKKKRSKRSTPQHIPGA